MKKLVFILPVTVLLFFCTSCEKNKEAEEKETNENFITIELDGNSFKSTSINDFESLSDTSKWNIYTGGQFNIDTVNTFNGKSSAFLIAIDHCFETEKIEGVPVDKNKIYVIHFYYKMPPVNTGLCPTFELILKQGNEYLINEVIDGYNADNSWTEKYFYFQPENNIPVKIDIFVGTTLGIWIDDLIIFEEY